MSQPGEKGRPGIAGLPEIQVQSGRLAPGRGSRHQPALHPLEDPQKGTDHPHVSPPPSRPLRWLRILLCIHLY